MRDTLVAFDLPLIVRLARGVQSADANGELSFLSVYPGCYPGRWPHAHFEVHDTLDDTTNAGRARKTSQLAMPQATSTEAFETTGYEGSSRNFAGMSPASDNVLSDGADNQLPTVTGSPTDGCTASLLVRI